MSPTSDPHCGTAGTLPVVRAITGTSGFKRGDQPGGRLGRRVHGRVRHAAGRRPVRGAFIFASGSSLTSKYASSEFSSRAPWSGHQLSTLSHVGDTPRRWVLPRRRHLRHPPPHGAVRSSASRAGVPPAPRFLTPRTARGPPLTADAL